MFDEWVMEKLPHYLTSGYQWPNYIAPPATCTIPTHLRFRSCRFFGPSIVNRAAHKLFSNTQVENEIDWTNVKMCNIVWAFALFSAWHNFTLLPLLSLRFWFDYRWSLRRCVFFLPSIGKSIIAFSGCFCCVSSCVWLWLLINDDLKL